MVKDLVKTAILGASGMVGRKFAKLLLNHPMFDVVSYTGYSTAGRRYREVWDEREARLSGSYGSVWTKEEMPAALEDVVIEMTGPEQIEKKDVKVVFSALDNNPQTEELEKRLAEMGVNVFSNVSCMRLNKEIPLVVAEVNSEDLCLVEEQEPYKKSGGFIVKNANCTTIGLVMALRPIHSLYGLEWISVVTAQALSGKGDNAYENGLMDGNVYPSIDGEEEKVRDETRKILHLNGGVNISATCTRVNVRDGHMGYIRVKTRKKPDLDMLKRYMLAFNPLVTCHLTSSPENPIIITEEKDRPQPKYDVLNGNGMAVTVGRMDYDSVADLKFVALSHNTIRGAAGSSIQNAELYFNMFK